MPDAVFKDLCLDACDAPAAALAWGTRLGLAVSPAGDPDRRLSGATPEHTVWVNQVPEPRTVEDRVRLDVRSAGDADLVVGSEDPAALAGWWAERLGASVQVAEREVRLEGVPGLPYRGWRFVEAAAPKTVKNRVHWDVTGQVDVLVVAGATVLDVLPSWTVLADPEGNEFCCFSPP